MSNKQWFQGSNGVSALRIMTMFACVLGGLVVSFGLLGWFMGLPDVLAIMAIGGGMMGTAMASKAWQKQAEVKAETPTTVSDTPLKLDLSCLTPYQQEALKASAEKVESDLKDGPQDLTDQ